MSNRKAAVRTKHGRQAWRRRRHYPHDQDGGQRQRWWSGGDFQCPPLQRQAGGRNLTVIELEPCQLFVTTFSKSVSSSSSSSDIGTTSSGINRPRTPNSNVVFIGNKVKYEGCLRADANSGGGGSQRPALQRAGGQRFTVIDREPSTVPSIISITSTVASSDAASSAIDAPSKLGEAKEMVELASNLEETNNQNEDTIQHLQQQLSEMKSQNESVKAEKHSWKKKHARMERLNYELIEEMAAKELEQLYCHSDTVKADAVHWKCKYEQMGQLYDELVEKIGGLADENGQLHIKCQQLEEDERKLNDVLVGKIVHLANENEKLECESVPSDASFEASPMQDAASTVANSRSFSGDVYEQLDQFEHSLDVELEDFQQLGSLEIPSVVVMMASSGENEKDTSANNSEDSETNGKSIAASASAG